MKFIRAFFDSEDFNNIVFVVLAALAIIIVFVAIEVRL
jgi:hypothetical protein